MSYFCRKKLNFEKKNMETYNSNQQLTVKSQQSLLEYNTMGFDITAKKYYKINSLAELDECIEKEVLSKDKRLILGGGSNILFSDEYFDGTIIHSNLKGITIDFDDNDDNDIDNDIDNDDDLVTQRLGDSETQNYVTVRCMSGEIWKDFVDFTIKKGLYGLENLVDIPGSVGAAPVQNIGAYGVEVKDCIDRVYTIDLTNGDRVIFNNKDCHFAYRDSIFKREENKKYFIVAIDFKLKKEGKLRLDYGNIKEYLEKNDIVSPSLLDIANAIKNIRAEKLPEVGVIGSVGSFFQNPIVDNVTYKMLKDIYPEMPSYPNDNGVKIPAGWLIDKAGWKGYKENHVGVWDKQALVLVHYGGGKPEEILSLMRKIQDSVKEKFGIEIKPEVNIVS
ncbi:MAG: UDP-N-acetylmuramate dehydrogenase [Lentimicrobiaceae bacterium]|nr:UDP-N-acetylmuramate dehydrogenase [Lentimicrobiaceae bacterium]